MAAGVKIVKMGSLSARLSRLKTGVHAGKWKIRYKNLSGQSKTGGLFKDLNKAESRAREILKRMILDDVGTLSPNEISVVRYMRGGFFTIEDAIMLRKARKTRRDKEVGSAVTDFLSVEVEGAGYSQDQEKDYRRVLNDLRSHFAGSYVWQITLEDLEKWASQWRVGPARFNNKRGILKKFWAWCAARELCGKNVAGDMTRKRKSSSKNNHDVLTPEQFATCLVKCPEMYIPWLALSGFAGLRGVEIYGRNDNKTGGLQWENIHWEKKIIHLDLGIVKKTTKARIIPMCDALIEWLRPWRGKTGSIHPFRRPSSGSDSVTLKLGGLIGGWRSNGLRASRASYRMAECMDINLVRLEMGHSRDVLLGTYLNPRFKDSAKLWFSLTPARARELVANGENKISRLG